MITMLRGMARAVLPASARLALLRAMRGVRDRLSGDARRLARHCEGTTLPPHCVVEISQQIRNGGYYEGKLANIRLGATRLDGVTLAPGDILSFWALVGCPSPEAGFREGRAIRDGIAVGEIGGGLCQVSGIAYELGLRAGLRPVERHPHSRDLYEEEERFTPLGLDATIVWPSRDLRLANPFDVPVTLRFAVNGATLHAALHASRPIAPLAIEIARTDDGDWRNVIVSRLGADGRAAVISHDRYLAVRRS